MPGLLVKIVSDMATLDKGRPPELFRRPSVEWLAPHSGQSSQLLVNHNHKNAQFLSTVARSALVRQAIHIPQTVANPVMVAPEWTIFATSRCNQRNAGFANVYERVPA
jgi:hypothetical protein